MDTDATIGDLLRRTVQRDPDGLAVVDARRPSRRWTWAGLHEEATAIARRLAASHPPGSVLAVWAVSDPAWIVLELAAALAGVAVQPIDPTTDATVAATALRRTGAVTLAVSAAGLPDRRIIDAARAEVPTLRSVVGLGDPLDGPTADLPEVTAAMPALILPTSGTTGRPKAALLSHRAVTTDARLVAARMDLRPEDTWLTVMPLHRSGGCATTVLGCVATGATMVCAPPSSPTEVLRLLPAAGVTVLSAFPRALQDLVDTIEAGGTPHRPGPVRLVQTGGAPVSPALVHSVARGLGGRVSVVYGMTEAAPVLTQTDQRDRDDDPAASVGRPLPSTELAVLGVGGDPVAPGELGQIVARGPQLMDGYVGDPDATSRAIDRAGWLHTGDAGWLDGAGRLHVEGRLDDVIDGAGDRWLPGPAERALAGVPGVGEAVVVGVPGGGGRDTVVAFVRPRRGHDVTEDALRAAVAAACGEERAPDRVVFVGEMPALPSGKVRRFVLREWALDGVNVPG